MIPLSLKLFLKDKLVIFFIGLNILENLGNWIYLLSYYRQIKEQTVFLHYTVHLGVDLVGPRHQLFFIPLFGLMIFLVNSVLAYFLFQKRYYSRILILGSAVTQTFVLAGGVFLIFLNL